MTNPPLELMQVFAAVVEADSFTLAADRLKLSKAAVSRHVSQLESRLGVRLLNRTTRRLSLTEAGRVFYEGCQRLLQEARAAEAAVTALAINPGGLLRLAAPMTFGVQHLARELADFIGACPEMKLELVLSDRSVDLVEEGFDAALRIGTLADSALVARRLAPLRRLVCAAPAYLKRRGLPTRPEALAAHDCLIYSYQGTGRVWHFRHAQGQEKRVTITGRVEANNGEALLAFAVAGQGIAFTPTFAVAPALRDGSLVPLLPDWQDAADAGIHLVYPARRHLSPKVRALIDFLAPRWGEEPPWDRELPKAVGTLADLDRRLLK